MKHHHPLAEPDFDVSTFPFLAQIDQAGPQEMLAVLATWENGCRV